MKEVVSEISFHKKRVSLAQSDQTRCLLLVVVYSACIFSLLLNSKFSQAPHLNLNLNSLLVLRQIDNPSPGAVTGGN